MSLSPIWTLWCDRCNDWCDTGNADHHAQSAIEGARAQGWKRIRRRGEATIDLCPACARMRETST